MPAQPVDVVGGAAGHVEQGRARRPLALPDERVQRIAEVVAAAGAAGNTVSWHTKLAAKALLQLGSQGNVQSETLKAFSEDEYRKLVGSL